MIQKINVIRPACSLLNKKQLKKKNHVKTHARENQLHKKEKKLSRKHSMAVWINVTEPFNSASKDMSTVHNMEDMTKETNVIKHVCPRSLLMILNRVLSNALIEWQR